MAYVVEQHCSVPDLTVPHFTVDRASFDDLDRTLAQTKLCMGVALNAALDFGLSEVEVANIQNTQRETEADKRTFEPITALREALGDRFPQYIGALLRTSPEASSVAYADTASYLMRERETMTPNMCITYGTQPLWQLVKGILTGYTGTMVVTDTKLKWSVNNTFRAPDGSFSFFGLDEQGIITAVYHCRHGASMTDDRNLAHVDTPEDCYGYVLQRANEERLPGQEGELPEAVHGRLDIVQGLDDIPFTNTAKLMSCGAPKPDGFHPPQVYKPTHQTKEYPTFLLTPQSTPALLEGLALV